MSDFEDVTPANTDFPSSDVLLPSLPKQSSILSQSLEASVPIQSSESSDIASAFSLFKDYFDKKLGALKRNIQEDIHTAFAGQHSSSSRPIARTLGAFSKQRPSDICFACGQQGHWSSQCQVNPQARSSSSRLSFPSSSGLWGIGGK